MRRYTTIALLAALIASGPSAAIAQIPISSDHPPTPAPFEPRACTNPNGEVSVLKAVRPDDPIVARDLGLQPVTVDVLVTVSATGRVTAAKVVTSSKNIDIDRVAMRVARLSEYTPKHVDCKPVRGEYLYRVYFGPSSPAQFPVPPDGLLQFPAVNGIQATLKLRLTSPASAGTTLTIRAQTAVAGLPAPEGSDAKVLAVFSLETNNAMSVAFSPEFTIVTPYELDVKKPYFIYAYEIGPGDIASEMEGWSQAVNGRTLTTQGSTASTCPVPPANGIECYSRTLKPGYTYAFELVENPLLPPHP